MMRLGLPESERFYRVFSSLLNFVNSELRVVVAGPGLPAGLLVLDPGDMIDIRDAWLDHPELTEAFAEANPDRLSAADCELARSWRHVVEGAFFVYRETPDGAIFLSEDEPITAYRVLTHERTFQEVIGKELPRLIGAVLYPVDGHIVTDGLLEALERRVPKAVRLRLDTAFQAIEARGALITDLVHPGNAAASARTESPIRAGLVAPAKPKPKAQPKAKGKPTAKAEDSPEPEPEAKVPAASREAFDRIVVLLDAFCRDHLDAEYADACRRMAGLLARQRPAPILKGKPEGWAAGIVRSVGFVNFLGDPSQPHHMKMSEVDRAFGVSEATGSAKGTLIRRLLDVDRFGAEWTLPSRLKDNPMIWMLKINGLVMDIRNCPREAQVVAFERGLIPYIPADRGEGRPRR